MLCRRRIMALRGSPSSAMAVLVVSAVLFCFLCLAASGREILIDDDSPVVKTSTVSEDGSEDAGGQSPSTCHMEYQVVKRVVGRCIKVGRAMRGCVAGNYLHPFHPECL